MLIVLGDHQPLPIVSGQSANHDVPISIIAHDPKVLNRIGAGAGGRPAAQPAGAGLADERVPRPLPQRIRLAAGEPVARRGTLLADATGRCCRGNATTAARRSGRPPGLAALYVVVTTVPATSQPATRWTGRRSGPAWSIYGRLGRRRCPRADRLVAGVWRRPARAGASTASPVDGGALAAAAGIAALTTVVLVAWRWIVVSGRCSVSSPVDAARSRWRRTTGSLFLNSRCPAGSWATSIAGSATVAT